MFRYLFILNQGWQQLKESKCKI